MTELERAIHEKHIRECLLLARRGRLLVEPNPMVGAVLVRNGEVAARGYHGSFGGPHAEVEVFRAAGELARGADLYVSLEPCSTHGKTPPCVDAILASGVRRVFWAINDPNPHHAGRAAKILGAAGIEVFSGFLQPDAEELIAEFRSDLAASKPFVVAKWAQTLDGRIADRTGASKWISSVESRRRVHEERARCDGVLVGVETALRDDPLLTTREVAGRSPRRFIVDTNLRAPATLQLFADNNSRTTVFCRSGVDPARRQNLEKAAADIVECPLGADGRLKWSFILNWLRHSQKITRLLVEGGGQVFGSLAAEGVLDAALIFISPRLLADGASIPALASDTPRLMNNALEFTYRDVSDSGGDIFFAGRLRKNT